MDQRSFIDWSLREKSQNRDFLVLATYLNLL